MYRYAYTYDPAGNRLAMVHYDGASTATMDYEYNAANQLIGYNDLLNLCSYDSNGNMIEHYDWATYEGKEYHHNRENRLTSVWPYMGEDPLVEYTYDALGRRIMRTDADGNKLRYYYNGLGVLLVKEKPSGGSWRTKNVYALKQASLGHIISERTNTAWNGAGTPTAWTDTWYHFDMLGNTTAETGSLGDVTAHVDMEAYGNVISGGQNGYRLTTQYHQSDEQLYYMNQRWLNPQLGIFLEIAPMPPVIEHPYLYASASPTAYVDPEGNLALRIAGGCLIGLAWSLGYKLYRDIKFGRYDRVSGCEKLVGYLCQAVGGCGAGAIGAIFGGSIAAKLEKLPYFGRIADLLLPMLGSSGAGLAAGAYCKSPCDAGAEALCKYAGFAKEWRGREDEVYKKD
jgi:RHS repeat-associated protein